MGLNISFPPELAAQIAATAKGAGQDPTQLVHAAVGFYLNDPEQRRQRREEARTWRTKTARAGLPTPEEFLRRVEELKAPRR